MAQTGIGQFSPLQDNIKTTLEFISQWLNEQKPPKASEHTGGRIELKHCKIRPSYCAEANYVLALKIALKIYSVLVSLNIFYGFTGFRVCPWPG